MVNNGDVLSNIELGVGGQQQDVKKADESPEKSPRSNGINCPESKKKSNLIRV
jgi:hypothetical protein